MWRLTLLSAADRTNNQRPIIRRPNEASSDTLIRERTAKSGSAPGRWGIHPPKEKLREIHPHHRGGEPGGGRLRGARERCRHLGRGRDLPVSDLRQVGRYL